MACRLNKCKYCESYKLSKLLDLDPDSKEMNMRVAMVCEDCREEDEYMIISYYSQHERDMGYII